MENKFFKLFYWKISFIDVIYYSILLIGNNYSYDKVNVILNINNLIDVSTRALIKHRNNVSSAIFINLNDKLIENIYSRLIRNGHLQVVEYLVSCDADIYENGYYLFILTFQYGHLNVIKYVVKNT